MEKTAKHISKELRIKRNESIVNQYNLGANKKDLANIYNMTVQNVNAIIRNYNKPSEDTQKDTISKDIEEFVNRIEKIKKIPSVLKTKWPREITFDNKIDAEIILETMIEFIVLRGKASLARFYLLNGMKCHKHDHTIGWESASYFIKNSKIMFLGPDKGYRINLAPTSDIEYDMVNDMLPKDKMVKIYESER